MHQNSGSEDGVAAYFLLLGQETAKLLAAHSWAFWDRPGAIDGIHLWTMGEETDKYLELGKVQRAGGMRVGSGKMGSERGLRCVDAKLAAQADGSRQVQALAWSGRGREKGCMGRGGGLG